MRFAAPVIDTEVVMQIHRPSPLLHLALALDAVASGVMSLALIAGAGLLAPWLALPEALLREAGLILVPYVAGLVLLVRRSELPLVAIHAVIVCNVVWVAASILLLTGGLVAPSTLGTAFVIAQAVAVAFFAELQVIGLRRGHAVAT
jgi:hypothetical protein